MNRKFHFFQFLTVILVLDLVFTGLIETQPARSSTDTLTRSQENAQSAAKPRAMVDSGSFVSPDGKIQAYFPDGSIDTGVSVDVINLDAPLSSTSWRGASASSFMVRALDGSGAQVTSLSIPATITVTYSDQAIAGMDESILKFFYWNETSSAWQEASTLCPSPSSYIRDPANNQLSLPVCVLGEFALLQDKPEPKFGYFPFINQQTSPAYTVTGNITDKSGTPLMGVAVDTNANHSATSDKNGKYTLSDLSTGTYTLDLSKNGYSFPQTGAQIHVTGNQAGPNFVATPEAECYEAITNGGFENSNEWMINGSAYPATYSTQRVSSGLRSMRAGIVKASDNRYSFSAFSQYIDIPDNATSISLVFGIYQVTTETSLMAVPSVNSPQKFSEEALSSGTDVNYAILLDEDNNQIGNALFSSRLNSSAWVTQTVSIPVTDTVGHRVLLKFVTYNDGSGGVTGMYIDNVSMTICTSSATPPPACSNNVVENSTFEDVDAWTTPGSYLLAPYYTDAKSHNGDWSMLAGTPSGDEPYGYSIFEQEVTIPSSAVTMTLSYWMYPQSKESHLTTGVDVPPDVLPQEVNINNDVQYMALMDNNHNLIKYLMWRRNNDKSWEQFTFDVTSDLTAYKGDDVILRFGVANDGDGLDTAMYIDDVYLYSCP